MRLLSLISALAFAEIAVVFGQITIHSTDFPAVGTSFTWGVVRNVTFDPGSAGANQTWTFQGYTWDWAYPANVVEPLSTPHGTSFPAATHAARLNANGTDVCSYFRLTSNAEFFLGVAEGDSVRDYAQASTELVYPCTYQTQWTSVRRYEYSRGGASYVEKDSVINMVDGWGTVTTPYITCAALRMFSHQWGSTTHDGGVVDSSWEALGYQWKAPQAYSVVEVYSQDISNPNFTQGEVRMLGMPLTASPVRGPVANRFAVEQNYPNPFNPTTALPVILDRPGSVSVDIYDETGRLISHEQSELSAGQHDFRVNGSGWASGSYFARVSASGQSQTMKMQLVK